MHRGWFLALLALCACSDAQCRGMHGVFAGLVCGGQGDDPPGPDSEPVLACADLSKQAPAFFALLDDPSHPLDPLRATVTDLAAVQCFDKSRASCTDDSQCHGLTCDSGLCACRLPYNALGEVLRAGLRGLAAASTEPPESASDRCVSIAEAAQLATPNHLCELKRAWSVIRASDGFRALLADERFGKTLRALSDYASGKADGTVHDGVAGTFGRMARRNDLCDPADLGTLVEKLLANLTPALADEVAQKLEALVNDPTLRPLLLELASGGNPQGRASIIYLAHYFITEIAAVNTGAEASKDFQDILDDVVYPEVSSGALKQHIQDAADLLKRAISDDIGAFPALQRTVACAANPAIDTDPDTGATGEMIGAVWDLVVNPQGVDIPVVLDLLREAVNVDQDGQVIRAAHGLVAAMVNDEQALDASRAMVAEALCGPGGDGSAGDGRSPQGGALETVCNGSAFAEGLLPAVTLLVERNALGDLITLLSDVLDGCGK